MGQRIEMYRKSSSSDLRPALSNGGVETIFRAIAANDTQPVRLALIGNFAPRKCGIATFTTDVYNTLHQYHPKMGPDTGLAIGPAIAIDLYVLDDRAEPLDYEQACATIPRDDPDAYARAARAINESGADAVWLQHEYGIFGGECGEMVCDFVDRLAPPLILTCHTVLGEPSPREHAILSHLVSRASRVMVMSRHGRDLLASRYGAPHDIIQVIEHGAPDRPFGRQEHFKQQLGLSGRTVLTTFGLIGPGKGLASVIEAMPRIVERDPTVLYRIIGATHPNLLAREGEACRERLQARAEELGVAGHIEWVNRFLDTDELLDHLEACDIYITPYSNMQQSTSGTLSYAVALGKAVISTPYVHARELLAEDVGLLIPPDSPDAIAGAVTDLLGDRERLATFQRRAYIRGRSTIWPHFAAATARLVRSAVAPEGYEVPVTARPGLSAVLAMSDSTGILQHSIGIVPNRAHGYCLDDNARALMLMNLVDGLDPAERMRWSMVYAAFVQDAWNPDARRFRNFLRFDRTWAEDTGSDDSNGRAIWALGQTVEYSLDADLREWAMGLYTHVLPALARVESPRAIAFAMLGACSVLRALPDHGASREFVARGAAFLEKLLGGGRRPDWAWFEAVLGYDNPRLSQALIEAGLVHRNRTWIGAGLETLEWIARQQVSSNGHFRPVGSNSFGKPHCALPFDQQPLEAQAAIEAAHAAYRATSDPAWLEHARTAWRWFFGANDRGAPLADLVTGRCRDGVTPRGPHANCGAESILAFQLSHHFVVALYRMAPEPREGHALGPSSEQRQTV